MRADLNSNTVRALAITAAVAIAVQLLFFDEPAFAVRIVAATWDKLVHFTVFGGIAFLLWVGTGARWPVLVWALVALLGALDEAHQVYVPGRTADIEDFFADAIGAACALLVLQALSFATPHLCSTRVASMNGG
ncbi:MAG TPA: VanZ family protein [Usitatibacter sp.]|nr:VanZ family protein [Usitatibacter sp.]